MASKTISAWEARRNFGKFMNDVATDQSQFIVESHGSARMAMVPLHILDDWEARRQHLFDTWESVAARVNLSEEKAMALAEEAVTWARSTEHAVEPDR